MHIVCPICTTVRDILQRFQTCHSIGWHAATYFVWHRRIIHARPADMWHRSQVRALSEQLRAAQQSLHSLQGQLASARHSAAECHDEACAQARAREGLSRTLLDRDETIRAQAERISALADAQEGLQTQHQELQALLRDSRDSVRRNAISMRLSVVCDVPWLRGCFCTDAVYNVACCVPSKPLRLVTQSYPLTGAHSCRHEPAWRRCTREWSSCKRQQRGQLRSAMRRCSMALTCLPTSKHCMRAARCARDMLQAHRHV